jgi:hypothetical protein
MSEHGLEVGISQQWQRPKGLYHGNAPFESFLVILSKPTDGRGFQ